MESKHRSYIVQRLKRHQTQFPKQELKLANALITLELTRQNFTDLIKIVNPHFREEYQKAKNQFNQLSKNDKYLNGAGFDFIFMEKGDYKFEKMYQSSDGRAGSTRTSLNPTQKVKYVQTLLKMQQIKSQSYQKCLLKLFSILRIYEQISTTKSAEKSMMKSERSNSSIIQQKMENQFQNDSFSKDSANQLSIKSNQNIQKAKQLNMVKKNEVQHVQNSFQLQRKLEETKDSYEQYIKQLQQQINGLQDKLKKSQSSDKNFDEWRKNLQSKNTILQNELNRQKSKTQKFQKMKSDINQQKQRLLNLINQQKNNVSNIQKQASENQIRVKASLQIVQSLMKLVQKFSLGEVDSQVLSQIINKQMESKIDLINKQKQLQKQNCSLIQQNQKLQSNSHKQQTKEVQQQSTELQINRQDIRNGMTNFDQKKNIQRLTEQKRQIQRCKKQNIDLKQNIEHLQNQVKSMEVIIRDNDQLLNGYNQRIGFFEEQINQSKRIINQIHQNNLKINAVYNCNKLLRDENSKLQQQNQILMNQNRKSDGANRDIQNLIRSQITAFKKQLTERYQEHIRKNQEVITQLTRINSHLENINRQYNLKNVQLTNQIQRQQHTIGLIESERDQLHKQINQQSQLVQQKHRQKDSLTIQLQQTKTKIKSLQNKHQQITFSYKQLQSQQNKLQNQSQLSSLISTALTVSPILQSFKAKRDKLISFIQTFTNAKVMKSELKFKYDKFCHNFSGYLNTESFPFLVLFKLSKNKAIFGIFTTGIAFPKAIQAHQAFLFSLEGNGKMARKIEKSLEKYPVYFKDNFLTFGNGELSIKNNSADQIFRFTTNMLGTPYFSIPSKEELIGFDQNEDTLGFEEMEIHRIYY